MISSSASSASSRAGRSISVERIPSTSSRSSNRAGSRNEKSKEENVESGKWEVGGGGDKTEFRVDDVASEEGEVG
jgi:hypothetical protein